MKQWNTDNTMRRENDLEQRLADYYGPPVREQPLSHTSWQHLKQRLKRRAHYSLWQRLNGPARSMHRVIFKHNRSRRKLPGYIEEICMRVTYEAREAVSLVRLLAMLRCSFEPSRREATMHVSFGIKPVIELLLPVDAEEAIGQAGFDTLIAGGLARYLLSYKLSYAVQRLLLASAALAGCLFAIYSWLHTLLLIGLPITLMLLAAVVYLLDVQKRKMVMAADVLVVRWMGRERMCRGLHELADRSRWPYRRRWGEPSLAERVARVCGTHIKSHDENLTLAR